MIPAEKNQWDILNWTPERERIIYRDWGTFYFRKQSLDTAVQYYNKSLHIRDDDPQVRYSRSICNRKIAQTFSALQDALAAKEYDPDSAPNNLAVCDALYELNQFENNIMELHDNAHKFKGTKAPNFLNRLTVVEENFNDNLGDALNPFIFKNGHLFETVHELMKKEKYVDPRPLWKILKERNECDVLSILEKEEVFLSPREVARRDLAFNVFNQNYINRSWVDLQFLKGMRQDPKLLISQSKLSTPYLKNLTSKKYDVITKLVKMLHSRSPLYSETVRRCPNKMICQLYNDAHLYRKQYATRRKMLYVLRSIKKMRAEGDCKNLSRFVEKYMGEEMVKKTHRIMPWKFEFLNEVYNTVALAYADRLVIPEGMQTSRSKNKLLILLQMPTDQYKDPLKFIFGNRSSFKEPDGPDYAHMAYKSFQARMERRLRFAKYSIEKCYILYSMAHSHLINNHYPECSRLAREAIEETNNCQNYLWKLVSIILILKSFAVLHKVERCKEVLLEAAEIAEHLKNSRIMAFIEMCDILNEQEISFKRQTHSSDTIRSRRKYSTDSFWSPLLSTSDPTLNEGN